MNYCLETSMQPIKCVRTDRELVVRTFGDALAGSLCCAATDSVDLNVIDNLNSVKEDLNNGIWPKHCLGCKKDEDNNILSWRQIGNQRNDETQTLELYVENTCDLACIYCSPKYSSKWESEIKNSGSQKELLNNLVNDSSFVSNHKINHKQDILSIVTDMGARDCEKNMITLLGGEPFMTKYFKNNIVQDIVKSFYQKTSKDKKLKLQIITNGNTPGNLIDKILNSIAELKTQYQYLNIGITVSIDSAGANAELVRYGLDYSRLLDNFKKYLQNIQSVGCRITLNTVSLDGTIDLLSDLFKICKNLDKKIFISFGSIKHPQYLSTCILPKDKKSTIENIKKYIEDNIKYVDENCLPRLSDELRESIDILGSFDLSKKQKEAINALEFFDYIKNSRGVNIQEINYDLFLYYKGLAK